MEEGEVVTGDALLRSADAGGGNGSCGADPTHQMDAALNLAMLETLWGRGSCEEAAFDALNDAIRLAEGTFSAEAGKLWGTCVCCHRHAAFIVKHKKYVVGLEQADLCVTPFSKVKVCAY